MISLYRVGFHSPQTQMTLFLHMLKSNFPCEKCILCKVLSLCKRPSDLSLDAGSLFLPSFTPLTSFSSSSLPPLPLLPFLSFSLALPDVSIINRLKPRLFCVMFSVRKTSACVTGASFSPLFSVSSL